MSELTRSPNCQSGPCSSRTTFLPALASTAAKIVPDAPAPTMATSTFSFAMSPPRLRRDVRHIGNAERVISRHGAVDDIDGIAAQHRVNEWRRRALPAFQLVLPHAIDEIVLLRRALLDKAFALRLAHAINCAERGTIEIDVGRTDVDDTRDQQRIVGRTGNLLIDKLNNPGITRPWHERLAERFQGLCFVGVERTQRHALRARLAGSEKYLGAANREG